MNYESRPPFAGDSTSSNEYERQHNELWQWQMQQPLVPEWAEVIGEPCVCCAGDWTPEVIMRCEVPFERERVALHCLCCGKIWVEKR